MNAQLPVVQKAALMAGSRPTAIVPESIEQVWRLSELMSKSGLAPKDLDTPEKCAVAILHGLEVGLSPMQAVQKIAVINGRPTIWGDAALGLVMASGLCESIREEGDENSATCTVKRVGNAEVSRTFTAEDAKRARLLDKPGPWQQYRKRMMQMRARGFTLRDVFADVLGGMYIREELEGSDDFKDATPAAEPPTPPEPPAIEPKKVQVAENVYVDCGPVPDPTAERDRNINEEMMDCYQRNADPPQPPPNPPPGTDALGGKPESDAIPPGLRRAMKPKEAPPFKLDAWLKTLAAECQDKTPAQLLDLRVKMIEPLKERLGHDGYNRAGDVMGAAMEVAQKKYAPAKPAFDPDQWYRDLEGAISGCTTIEQIIEVQKKVQQPALEFVSREHYAKGKKLVQAALIQLSDED